MIILYLDIVCWLLTFHDLKSPQDKSKECFVGSIFLANMYRKVTSSNTSRLGAHAGFFRFLMKGIFNPYVLWPYDKKLISEYLTRVRTCDYTVHFIGCATLCFKSEFMLGGVLKTNKNGLVFLIGSHLSKTKRRK